MQAQNVFNSEPLFMGKAIKDDLIYATETAFSFLEDSLVLYLQNYPNKDTSTWIEDACRKFFRGVV